MINKQELIDKSNLDICSVNQSDLIDIENVHINSDLPLAERVIDYISQIKNPYCCKIAGTVVKLKFSDTTVTMEERMTGYFKSL